MMQHTFLRRLFYYLIGVGIGLIFVFFVFGNRGCSWLPQNKVKETINHKILISASKKIPANNIQKILLDFYLVNCTLSPNGFKVRATIDGTEFLLTNWQAYTIEGLKEGKHEIKLELIDKNNVLVKSPYNPVVRTFVTSLTEPLPNK